MTSLLILTLLTPFLASLWALFGRKNAGFVVLSSGVISVIASSVLLVNVINEASIIWSFGGLPGLPFVLEVYYFNTVISLIVAGVSSLIFLYSLGYMYKEGGKTRFWSGISLFLFSMQILVFSGDWILFIIGWEIMGYASYQLISTWYWKQETGKAANKAFLINRFTDLGLYIGVFVIILQTGSSEISELSYPISRVGMLALLLGVMGKSAQVPFQSWLSAAMKGPTPVSALLHSATMVAAGIILLIKAEPLFDTETLKWIAAVGVITIVLTGFTAVFSDDIKQMLAASTSSQLGFMVFAFGAGFPGAAMAHLVAHAFMKSSLFLGAGVYQHAAGSTNFEKITGAGKKLKITFTGFAIASVALAGIPPFIGYFSKDAVLSAGVHGSLSYWYFSAAMLGAFLTAFYMSRACGILWKGEVEEIEPPTGLRRMQTGLIIMVLFVIGGGFFIHKMVVPAGLHLPKAEIAKTGGLLLALTGLVSGWIASFKKAETSITEFIRKNYAIAGGYHSLVVLPTLKLAQLCSSIDNTIHQFVLRIGSTALGISSGADTSDQTIHKGVFGVGRFGLSLSVWSEKSDEQGIDGLIAFIVSKVQKFGEYGRRTQSGLVHQELMWSAWGMVVFVILMLFTLI